MVGRYPTIKLMSREPIPVRVAALNQEGCPPRCYGVLVAVSSGYPPDRARLLTRYAPLRRSPSRSIATPHAAPRLACVKPAASVHPEPGSNSSLYISICLCVVLKSLSLFSKNRPLLSETGCKDTHFLITSKLFCDFFEIIFYFCAVIISVQDMPEVKNREEASLFRIFMIFAKIGAFTIGGGYAMIPLIQNEMVRRGWLDEKEFPDLIALSQTAPGILAVNISIFVGYKLRGTKGSVVATLGSIVPSFLIILVIAMAFTGYQDNPVVMRIFKGIRPVVVALIAAPMVRMAMKNNGKWWHWAIMLASLAMTAFLGISPIYIMLCVIVIAAAVTMYNDKRYRRKMHIKELKGKKKEEGK